VTYVTLVLGFLKNQVKSSFLSLKCMKQKNQKKQNVARKVCFSASLSFHSVGEPRKEEKGQGDSGVGKKYAFKMEQACTFFQSLLKLSWQGPHRNEDKEGFFKG